MNRLLFWLLLIPVVGWAQAGSEAEPHSSIGPLSHWISNGRWAVNVERVTPLPDLSSYHRLDWRNLPEQHLSRVDRLTYRRGGQAVLLEFRLKNTTAAPATIGFETPTWTIRCDDGQEVLLKGVERLPKQALLNPGAGGSGYLGFFLPVGAQAKGLQIRPLSVPKGGEPMVFSLPPAP